MNSCQSKRIQTRNQKSLLTALTSLAFTISNGLLGVIVTRIILVQFGSDFNGLNSTANQIVNMLLIIEGGFTLASNVALFSPLGKSDYETTNGILTATKHKFVKIGIAFLIIGLIVSFAYSAVVITGLNRALIFTIILMAIIPQTVNLIFTCTYRVLLQAEQKEYIINLISLVTTVSAHIMNIITIPLFKQMWLIRFITMFFTILSCIIINIYVKRNYSFINLRATPRNDLIVGTNDVFAQKITGVIYSSSPIVFLSISPVGGTMFASVYAVYNSVFAIIKSLLNGVIDAPRQGIGQLIKENDEERLWKVFEQYEYLSIMTVFCFISTASVLILPFIKLYTADITDINYSDYVIAVAMILITVFELLHIPSGQIINMSGKFNIAKKIQIAATIVIIASMSVLGQLLGIYGFLAAIILTAILLAILEIGYVHTKMFPKKLGVFFKLVLPLAITGITVCLLESWINLDIITNYLVFFAVAIAFFIGNSLIGFLIGYLFNKTAFLGLIKRINNTLNIKGKIH